MTVILNLFQDLSRLRVRPAMTEWGPLAGSNPPDNKARLSEPGGAGILAKTKCGSKELRGALWGWNRQFQEENAIARSIINEYIIVDIVMSDNEAYQKERTQIHESIQKNGFYVTWDEVCRLRAENP